jgi:hypothetical protein
MHDIRKWRRLLEAPLKPMLLSQYDMDCKARPSAFILMLRCRQKCALLIPDHSYGAISARWEGRAHPANHAGHKSKRRRMRANVFVMATSDSLCKGGGLNRQFK